MYTAHSRVMAMAAKTASITAVGDKHDLIPLDSRNLCEMRVEFSIADVGYVTSSMVKGAQSFDGTGFCVAFRFEKMLHAVIAGAMPRVVDHNIIALLNFRFGNETVEHTYDVGAGRCQVIVRYWVFGTEEILDTSFWHAKVVDEVTPQQ